MLFNAEHAIATLELMGFGMKTSHVVYVQLYIDSEYMTRFTYSLNTVYILYYSLSI